jgi:hypothetical protein
MTAPFSQSGAFLSFAELGKPEGGEITFVIIAHVRIFRDTDLAFA